MAKKYFGTDGIRGRVNEKPIDAQHILKLGLAAGTYFGGDHKKHRVLIGKDTRLSGYMIENAITSGLLATGMDVILLGPVPTPAVAMLTKSLRADLGIMISASHNPYEDNGIKFFNKKGFKLDDEIEQELERIVDDESLIHLAPPAETGKAKRMDDGRGRYIEYAKNTMPKDLSLKGLKIVLDCANGAAYQIAPEILWELGAKVITIGNEPNGKNINQDCGSTSTGQLIRAVLRERADIGIGLDGDADRIIAVDEMGQIIDGDQIMAVIAIFWQKRGWLKNNTVVATQMSNLGLENYLQSHNINLVRTQVGDRYVLQAMLAGDDGGHNFGGEQSGHIIFLDYSSTGDGIIAAIQILSILAEARNNGSMKASQVLRGFAPVPQTLCNVKTTQDPAAIMANANLQSHIKNLEAELAQQGRIFVRKSGTERLIRVMVEGQDMRIIGNIAEDIARFIENIDADPQY